MRKLFTLTAAILSSLTMMAQTITLSAVTPESNWYGADGVGRVTNKSGNAWSSPDMTCDGSTGYKTGSSYFTVQTYQDISALKIWARSTSNRTIGKIYVSDPSSSTTGAAVWFISSRYSLAFAMVTFIGMVFTGVVMMLSAVRSGGSF